MFFFLLKLFFVLFLIVLVLNFRVFFLLEVCFFKGGKFILVKEIKCFYFENNIFFFKRYSIIVLFYKKI